MVLEAISARAWSGAYWTHQLPHCWVAIIQEDMSACTTAMDRLRLRHEGIRKVVDLAAGTPAIQGNAACKKVLDDLGCHRSQLVCELWTEAEQADWDCSAKDFTALIRALFGGLRETKKSLENIFGVLQKSRTFVRWSRFTHAVAAHSREADGYQWQYPRVTEQDWSQDPDVPISAMSDNPFLIPTYPKARAFCEEHGCPVDVGFKIDGKDNPLLDMATLAARSPGGRSGAKKRATQNTNAAITRASGTHAQHKSHAAMAAMDAIAHLTDADVVKTLEASWQTGLLPSGVAFAWDGDVFLSLGHAHWAVLAWAMRAIRPHGDAHGDEEFYTLSQPQGSYACVACACG